MGAKILNASSVKIVGGAKGDRTPDLNNAIVALSQLSYGPTRRGGRKIADLFRKYKMNLEIAQFAAKISP